MKTYIDRLREMPLEKLEAMIKRQKSKVEIVSNALEKMELIYDSRMFAQADQPSDNQQEIK